MECVADQGLDLLVDESQWPYTVVIKGLPDGEHIETVLNYLEASLRCEVRLIYQPAGFNTQAVAILNQQIQVPVQLERPLGTHVPTVETLGPVLGVYIAPVVPETKKQHIEQYCESLLGPGHRVARVEFHREFCCAIVHIGDTADILSIVSTEEHEIRRQPVIVCPYFKSLHDILINETVPDVVLRPGATVYENLAGKEPVRPPPSVQLPVKVEPKDPKKPGGIRGFFAKLFAAKPPPVPPRLPTESKNQVPGAIPRQTASQEPSQQGAAGHADPQILKPRNLTFTDTLSVSTQSAKLLVIAGLDKLYSSEEVQIEVQLIHCKVAVSAASKELLTDTELKVREKLNAIHERTVQVSTHLGYFVCRQDVQDRLILLLKQKDIKAVFGFSGASIKLMGMTKADIEQAEKLFHNSIEKRIVQIEEYQLEAAQTAVSELNKKSAKYAFAAAFISPPAMYVDVIGLVGERGKALEKDIKEYIAQRVETRKDHPVIEVRGANARFFLRFCESDLSKTLEQRKGKLEVTQHGKGDDIRLTLKVTGTQEDIRMARSTVDNIWHEHLDFNTIGADAEDEHIVIKTLSGYIGEGFLITCEDQFKCILARQITGDPDILSRSSSHQDSHEESSDEEQEEASPTLPVRIQKGKIARYRANALVNIVPPGMNLKHGKISESFLKEGGQEFEKDFTEKASKLKSGSKRDQTGWKLLETPGVGRLHCSTVYHVVLTKTTDQSQMRQCIHEVIKRVVQECNKNKYETLAMSPLGIGRLYSYDEDLVIQQMVKSLSHYMTGSHLRKVTIVIFEGPLCGKFSTALDSVASTLKPAAPKPAAKKHSKRSTRSRDDAAATSSGDVKARVTLYAENKKECMKAREDLKKKVKDEWLYEEKMDKVSGVSGETRKKILGILADNNVRSIAGNNHFLLRGEKEAVRDAKYKILAVITKSLGDKRSHPKGRSLPRYWTTTKQGQIHEAYELVPLANTDNTYKVIEKLVADTCDASKIGQGKDAIGLSHTGLCVTKVERIENSALYDNYSHKREGMLRSLKESKTSGWPCIKDLNGSTGPIKTAVQDSKFNSDLRPEVNEFYLFHGSKADAIRPICKDGLDFRVGGVGMFGKGVYGAEMAMKSDQYADDKHNRNSGGELKMFLIRMLLGNMYVCTEIDPPKFTRAPCCDCLKSVCSCESKKFDSVLGDNRKLFREFVVYSLEQCYPEYLITYKRQ